MKNALPCLGNFALGVTTTGTSLPSAVAPLGGSHRYVCDLMPTCTLEPGPGSTQWSAISWTGTQATGIATGNRELISEGHLISSHSSTYADHHLSDPPWSNRFPWVITHWSFHFTTLSPLFPTIFKYSCVQLDNHALIRRVNIDWCRLIKHHLAHSYFCRLYV